MTVYKNSINFLYSHFYILSIIFPIWTIYTFSIKSHHSYLNKFSILLPITTFYRLTIVSLYRHLYTKYIQITYNITYKGSLDFGIPGVSAKSLREHTHSRHRRQEPFWVGHKTYTKLSTFVKYVIKFGSTANPITNSKFVEEYVVNNKPNQVF